MLIYAGQDETVEAAYSSNTDTVRPGRVVRPNSCYVTAGSREGQAYLKVYYNPPFLKALFASKHKP